MSAAIYGTAEYGQATYGVEIPVPEGKAASNVLQPGSPPFLARTVIWRADRYGTRLEPLPVEIPVQGTITCNEDASPTRKLQLTVNDPDRITPFRDYLIPEITLTDAAGHSRAEPFGLFMATPPSTVLSGSRYSGAIEGVDITWRLANDTIDGGMVIAAGADHGAAARDVALGVGLMPHQLLLPDTGTVLVTDMVVDPGASRLQVITDLYNAVNWYRPWMNGHGIVTTEPWQDLATARASRRYSADDDVITIVPDLNERPNWDRVRNKVTVRNIAPDRDPIHATARITNPDHPLYHNPDDDATFPNWIAEVIDDPQVPDEATALARARANLGSGASYYRPVTFRTILDMTADLHDVVELDVQRHGKVYDGLWFRRAWQVQLRGVTALTESTVWRVDPWQ